MFSYFHAWIATREKGQGLVEYALLLVLIAIVVVGSLFLMGENLFAFYERIEDAIGPLI